MLTSQHSSSSLSHKLILLHQDIMGGLFWWFFKTSELLVNIYLKFWLVKTAVVWSLTKTIITEIYWCGFPCWKCFDLCGYKSIHEWKGHYKINFKNSCFFIFFIHITAFAGGHNESRCCHRKQLQFSRFFFFFIWNISAHCKSSHNRSGILGKL